MDAGSEDAEAGSRSGREGLGGLDPLTHEPERARADEGDGAEPGGGNGHDECLICGYKNPWSLGLRFESDQSDGVCGRFTGSPRLQGYEGMLHGGVVAALLDAAMAHCLFHQGIQGLTGDLHVRFVQPVSCDATLEVRSRVESAVPPLYYLRAELLDGERVMAWAKATFMQRGGRGRSAAGHR
ncbi:MAG: PaaI family thioesterase [Candidatus Eisenbacteria bacterium]|nr:PaaI family thioesterase [Candidatus Latescibacterota bacterium]MBD3302327.1 PaaI family thioesterase [Candidatus Eisenbacteria bacterium]